MLEVPTQSGGDFRIGGLVEDRTCRQPYARGTGGRWSDRAKAAYKSWQDYIIAVKTSPSYLK